VTTAVHERYPIDGRRLSPEVAVPLLEAWSRLSGDGGIPVVVRSSSTVEDIRTSSMAGRFRTVLDVRGRAAFLEAVVQVLASGDEVFAPAEPSPTGVLGQEYVSPPRAGWVMFGVDPVTGDPSHIVVEAVSGGPDKLLSGKVTAQHHVVARTGRLLSLDHRPVRLLHPHHHRRRLLHARSGRAREARPADPARVRRGTGRGVGLRAGRFRPAAAEPTGDRHRRGGGGGGAGSGSGPARGDLSPPLPAQFRLTASAASRTRSWSGRG
jgi:hypothetical protein